MDDEAESGMGHGGGANLEELRRVLKESGGKGKSSKSKRLNDDGTAETEAQRAALRGKAKQKGNPYYLNDEQDDVDAIPIVKLELDDNDAVTPSDGKVKRLKKAKKIREPSPPPPEIDRTGEMPEGSEALPKVKHTPAAKTSKKGHDGLKG
ncbi:hypothetical protein QFC21_007355 [Naganishia friedmannii]|uniref:Uncharacterized protein n=1 Tax=Naganishia friedmannii TaxID=89922 RepID=A0ACC2UWN6_9TREE|nr:hypothetical protein QFC21_007355 [Naganishia friedmannii]